MAPRGRPSDVHRLEGEHVEPLSTGVPWVGSRRPHSVPNLLPSMPRQAQGGEEGATGNRGGGVGAVINLASLPRESATEQGALAPRRESSDVKALYDPAGLVRLRRFVQVLARPLCEEVDAARRLCLELNAALQAEPVQEPVSSQARFTSKFCTLEVEHVEPLRTGEGGEREGELKGAEGQCKSVNPPQDVSQVLEMVESALDQVVQLSTQLHRVEAGCLSRLHNLEIESCFKLKEAHVLARPLCDEVETVRRLCSELNAALEAEPVQEPASSRSAADGDAEREGGLKGAEGQCVHPPQDVSQVLEMVESALEQIAQLSAQSRRVEAGCLSRLHNLEIESCFKLKEAQKAAVEHAAATAQLQADLACLVEQKLAWEAEREESTRQSNEAAELIRELNLENKNLYDRLAAEKETSSTSQEAAKAASRQVEALLLALEMQQRKSGGQCNSLELLLMTSPSEPRPPPPGDLQHMQPGPFNLLVASPMVAQEMVAEIDALRAGHSKAEAALVEQRAECEALVRVLKACRKKHNEYISELEARHQKASAAVAAELDATLAEVSALKLVVRSSVREREEGVQEEQRNIQKLQTLKQENDQYCAEVALLSAALRTAESDKTSIETALKHIVLSELFYVKQLAFDVEADCKVMVERLSAHGARQGLIQMGLIDVCADLHVLSDSAARQYEDATYRAAEWNACEMERQRLQREVEKADAVAVSFRDQVDVYRGKARVLQQEVEGAEACKLELDGLRIAAQKLQQEVQQLRSERDRLSQGVQSMDGAKSKHIQKMMDLQGHVSTMKHQMGAEKKNFDAIQQSFVAQQHLCTQQLEAAQAREQEAQDRAATVQLERDLLDHHLQELKKEHSVLQDESDKLRFERREAQEALNCAHDRLVCSSETLKVKEAEIHTLQQQILAEKKDRQKQLDFLQSKCDASLESLKRQLADARQVPAASLDAAVREHALREQTLEQQVTAAQDALMVASIEAATRERALRDQITAKTSLIGSLQKQVEASRYQATTTIAGYGVDVEALASEVARVRTQALQNIAALQETCETRFTQFVEAQQCENKRLKLVVNDIGNELAEAQRRINLLMSERCNLDHTLQERELENKQVSESATQLRREVATLRAERDSWLAQQRADVQARDASAVEAQCMAVDTVVRDMNRKLEQVVARHAADIDALKGERSLDLEMATRKHNQALADLAAEHQREMHTWKNECTMAAKKHEQLLRQEQEEHAQKFSAHRREHQQLLADARQQAAQELDDARQRCQHVLDEVSSKLRSEIKKLQDDAQDSQTQIQKLKDDGLLLRQEHARELQQLRLNQNSRLEEVMAERDSSVAEMEEDCTRKTSVLRQDLENMRKLQERVNEELRISQERVICLEQQIAVHLQSAKRLDEDLTRERQHAADERKRREMAQVQLSEATARMRSLEVQLDALEKNAAQVQQKLANQVAQTGLVEQQLAAASQATAGIQKDADAGLKRVRECEMQLETCSKQMQHQRTLTKQAEMDAISQKEVVAALQTELALVRGKVKGLETELEARLCDLERQQRLAHEIELDAQTQSKAVLECKKELAEAREELKAEVVALQKMQARAESAELKMCESTENFEQLRTQLAALGESMSSSEAQAATLRNDCDAGKEKVAALEAQLMEAREEVRNGVKDMEEERAVAARHLQRAEEAEQRARDLEEQMRVQDTNSKQKYIALEERLSEEQAAAAERYAILQTRLGDEMGTRAVVEVSQAAVEKKLLEKQEEFSETRRELEEEVARLQALLDKRDRVQARILAIAPDLALEDNLRALGQLNTPATSPNPPTQGSLIFTESFAASASSDASRPKRERGFQLGLSLSEVGLSSPKWPAPPLDVDGNHPALNAAPAAGAGGGSGNEDTCGDRGVRSGGGSAFKDLEVAEYAMALAHMQAVNSQMRLINNTQREQLQDLEKAISQGSEARRTLSESLRQTRKREDAARKRAHELEGGQHAERQRLQELVQQLQLQLAEAEEEGRRMREEMAALVDARDEARAQLARTESELEVSAGAWARLATAGPGESKRMVSSAHDQGNAVHSVRPAPSNSVSVTMRAPTLPERQGVLHTDAMLRRQDLTYSASSHSPVSVGREADDGTGRVVGGGGRQPAQRDSTPELSPATFFRGLAGLSRAEMRAGRNGAGISQTSAGSGREGERAGVGKERELSEVNTVSRVQQQMLLSTPELSPATFFRGLSTAGSVSNWPSQHRLAATLRGLNSNEGT